MYGSGNHFCGMPKHAQRTVPLADISHLKILLSLFPCTWPLPQMFLLVRVQPSRIPACLHWLPESPFSRSSLFHSSQFQLSFSTLSDSSLLTGDSLGCPPKFPLALIYPCIQLYSIVNLGSYFLLFFIFKTVIESLSFVSRVAKKLINDGKGKHSFCSLRFNRKGAKN